MGQKDQVVGKICKLMCHSPLCPLREEAGIWITNRPPKGQRHTFCRIQILFRSNPATDIRKSAQPTSTSYPASTNKERIGASEASLKTSKSHFMLYFLESGAQPKISTHTITLPLYLGVPTHKVHQLATKLHCHAMKSLNKIIKTRHKIHFNNSNSDNGGSGRGVTGRAAGFRRTRRRPDRMADNLPDPH